MRRRRALPVAASLAAVVLTGCGSTQIEPVADPAFSELPSSSTPTTPETPGPAPAASETPSSTDAPAGGPLPDTGDDGERAIVTGWVDGDTVDTTLGRVRVLGIDTPERGDCGFEDATARAESVAPIGTAVLLVSAGAGKDDTDRYGRLLRYVDTPAADVGYELLDAGLAIARYDSRDGYGWHPRESDYIAADDATPQTCSVPAAPAPPPVAAAPPAGGGEPWNQPGPDLDCADIGQRVVITGPDYHGLDRDGDGVGCESYG
jgi:endonuclease YncB( thermonuclease family)